MQVATSAMAARWGAIKEASSLAWKCSRTSSKSSSGSDGSRLPVLRGRSPTAGRLGWWRTATARSGPGEGDVAGLAVQAEWSDDEHLVAGRPLSLVDGDGVAVIDMAVADVAAVEPMRPPVAKSAGMCAGWVGAVVVPIVPLSARQKGAMRGGVGVVFQALWEGVRNIAVGGEVTWWRVEVRSRGTSAMGGRAAESAIVAAV